MRTRRLKTLAKILGALVLALLIVLTIGPFLLPIRPLEGLVSAKQAAVSESHFLTIPFEGTDGIEVHYLTQGVPAADDAPTFVLLHGSLFNAFTWNNVIDFLGEYGRVVAYDQIPYGLSEKLVSGEWTARNPYTADAAVDQLLTVLDTLHIRTATLVGSSYGGALAIRTALKAPERVDALILADAAVYVQEELPGWLLALPQVRRLGPLFAQWLGTSEGFLRQTYAHPEALSEERIRLTLMHSRVEQWDSAFWEYLRVWGDADDITARIPTIQQPALVICGDSDAIVPVADSRRLHAALPRSELKILPSCGHVPQEECPERFKDAVKMWLNAGDHE